MLWRVLRPLEDCYQVSKGGAAEQPPITAPTEEPDLAALVQVGYKMGVLVRKPQRGTSHV